MENNGGFLRGRLKNWHPSEGLKQEADAAKGRLEEGDSRQRKSIAEALRQEETEGLGVWGYRDSAGQPHSVDFGFYSQPSREWCWGQAAS